MRILIVDDQEIIRRGVKRILSSRAEWTVCGEAASGLEALEKAKELQPDLILMDVLMPEMDGIEATRLIQREVLNSQVILISQTDPAVLQKQVQHIDALGSVSKSDLARDLLPTIDKFVGQRTFEKIDEQRLRLAMSAGKLGAWELELPEMRLTTSAQFRINYGRDPSLPMTYEERVACIDIRDRDRVAAAVKNAIDGKSNYAIEYRCIWPDGSVHWINSRALLIQDTRKNASRLVGVAQEVTEQKGTEEALRDAKTRLETTLSGTELATWTWNVGSGIIVADANLAKFFALTPEEAAGTHISRYYRSIHPADVTRVGEFLTELLASSRSRYEVEYRIVNEDGSVRWVEARGNVQRDLEGKAIQCPGVLIDITERKLAQERERELMALAVQANAKFRAVFSQSAQFAGIMTVDGVLIEANRLSLEACGYRYEEVVGRPFWQTPWWRCNKDVQEKIRRGTQLAAGGVPYAEELPYHFADGTPRIVAFQLHAVRDDDGKIIFLHPSGVDITERKQSEESIRRFTEKLEDEVRMRTAELEQRNAEVIRQSEVLRSLSQRLMEVQDQERRRIARELHDSAGQVLCVLKMDLENLSEIAAGTAPQIAKKAEGTVELVDQLSQEIRTMSYLLHPPLLEESGLSAALKWYVQGLSDRSGAKIVLEMPERMERLSRELELVIFRLIQECMTNVHRHSGSKTAYVRILSEPGKLLLEVKDNGRGIPPDRLASIASQGTGVGMQGMRERIRPFNGTMTVASNNKGTKITFQFPLEAARAEAV